MMIPVKQAMSHRMLLHHTVLPLAATGGDRGHVSPLLKVVGISYHLSPPPLFLDPNKDSKYILDSIAYKIVN